MTHQSKELSDEHAEKRRREVKRSIFWHKTVISRMRLNTCPKNGFFEHRIAYPGRTCGCRLIGPRLDDDWTLIGATVVTAFGFQVSFWGTYLLGIYGKVFDVSLLERRIAPLPAGIGGH